MKMHILILFKISLKYKFLLPLVSRLVNIYYFIRSPVDFPMRCLNSDHRDLLSESLLTISVFGRSLVNLYFAHYSFTVDTFGSHTPMLKFFFHLKGQLFSFISVLRISWRKVKIDRLLSRLWRLNNFPRFLDL